MSGTSTASTSSSTSATSTSNGRQDPDVETGQDLLAADVVATERMDNLALCLCLLTAAAKTEVCVPDKGKNLTALS